MAFGFTPKFEQDLELNGLDPRHYLAIALETVKELGWKISYTSRSGFIAIVGGGMFKNMETFQVSTHDNKVYIVSKNAKGGMFDWGRNKKHVNEYIDAFINAQANLSEQQLDDKLAELTPVFESTDEDRLALPPANFNDNIKSFFEIFVPRKGFFVTPLIIDANLLVFILMVASGISFFEPTTLDLLHWGANLRTMTLEGQWWRLITNTFLHIGIFHILFNMYALLYIGLILEPYIGRARFVAAYLFTGIIASLSSIYWHPQTVSAGASGAIFGMYGVFLAMLTTNIIDKSARKPLLASIGVFVAYNLMNGMKEGIDNAAHIGGLLSGLAIGYCFYPSLKRPSQPKLKYITISLLLIATLCTSFVIYQNIPKDTIKYEAYMKDFAANETAALSVFSLPKTSTNDVIAEALKDDGLRNWDRNLLVLDSIDRLDLPVAYTVRVYALRKYCKYRIKSYDYILADLDGNTNINKDSIVLYDQKIEAIIDSLKNDSK
ncbi:rhomboid family intramembrane serine protease [Mucilaginibacter sp.]